MWEVAIRGNKRKPTTRPPEGARVREASPDWASLTPNTRMKNENAMRPIVVGALIAGACYIVFAVVFWGIRGVPARRILQSVSSGLLGSKAYEGGVLTASLGLLLHFVIALIF